MQAYPHGGGYTPNHYPAAGDDHNIDDYIYNTPRRTGPDQHLLQPKQNTASVDDYPYNTPHQTGPDQRLPLPKQNTNSMDDYLYNTNSMDDCHYNTTRQMGPGQRLVMPKQNMMSMQRSPDEWIPPQKNYHHMDGYGGYNQNTNNFKSWSGNYSAPYPHVWPGKEQHYSVWSNINGYPVPGEINGGYRAAINEQRPYYYDQTKAPPMWVSKSIID